MKQRKTLDSVLYPNDDPVKTHSTFDTKGFQHTKEPSSMNNRSSETIITDMLQKTTSKKMQPCVKQLGEASLKTNFVFYTTPVNCPVYETKRRNQNSRSVA